MLDQPAWELRDPKSRAKFGVYEILSKLGQGGTGTVYGALDTRLNRKVAIKVMAKHSEGDFSAKRK